MSHAPGRPLPLRHPAALLATWGGVGLLPKAPGTWGSLAALPFAWLLLQFGGWQALALATLLVAVVGTWAADRYERAQGGKDPGAIVVDEVAGQWLALVPASLDPVTFALGFVLFRAFDILKPWPVGLIDRRVGGGLGVMLDDLVAGLYVLALLLAWRVWWTG